MPCDSSYMEASGMEKHYSQVLSLLGEFDGKPIQRKWWEGYHPDAYGKATRPKLDKAVADLCARLENAEVKNLSLEMQMWWRDHQAADAARLTREAKANRWWH